MKLLALFVVISMLPSCGYRPGSAKVVKQKVDSTQAELPMVVNGPIGPVHVVPGVIYELSYTDVVQPTPADSAASITIEGGGVSVNTGAGALLAELSKGLVSPWVCLVLGIGIFLAGGAIWLAKRRVVGIAGGGWLTVLAKQLPRGSGLLCMGTGAVVAVLPWFLTEYGWIIGLSAVATVGIVGMKYVHNLMKPSVAPDQDSIPTERMEKGR